MSTSSITNLFNAPLTSDPNARVASGGALGRDEFLELLTMQLRFQDPLEPVSNQEFAAQLAEFSALEQMEQINSTLESDLILSQSVHNAITTSMIGRDVRVVGGVFAVGEEEAELPGMYARAGAVSEGAVQIVDAEGNVVRDLMLQFDNTEPTRIEWDGKDADGKRVEPGTYSFTVLATGADGTPVQTLTFVEDKVTTIRFLDGVTELLLATVPYTLADVFEIRA